MATATMKKAEYQLVMTLNRDEAETLHSLTRLVGGSEDGSPRTHIQSIMRALRDAGVDAVDLPVENGHSSIYFQDYPKR